MKLWLPLTALIIISATTVKEVTTEHTIWDRILAQQAQAQTYRGNRALYFKSYQEAVRLFEKAVRSNPKDPKAHRQLGVALYWSGLVEESVEEYVISLKLNPRDADTHQVLGIAYAWLGRIDKAQEQFETAIRLDPHRADAEMNLGSIWDAKGSMDKSIYHLRRAISLEPKNALYHFQLGSIYAKYRDDVHAVKSFQRALAESPYYADVYLEIGASYMRLGNIHKAQSSLRKALRIKPGDEVARLLLSSLYRMQGNAERTEKMYRQALELTPGGDTNRLSLATAFRGNKNNDSPTDPFDGFRKNLERIPNDQGAQVTIEAVSENLAVISKRLSGVESAQRPAKQKSSGFKQMVELEPTTSTQRKSDIDKFLSDFNKNIDNLESQDNIRLNMDIKRDRPHSSHKNKKQKDAKPKAVYQPRRVGNDAGLWVMGTAWMRLIDDLIKKNLNTQGNDRLTRIERGIAYLQIGYADSAIEIFKKLIEQSGSDVIAWQGLAVAYVELGEIQEAIHSYRQMLSIEPKNRIAQESIKWLAE